MHTRSEALHALPQKSPAEASFSIKKMIRACNDPNENERLLMEAYQEFAQFLVHATPDDLSILLDDEFKKLSGSNVNRLAYFCHTLQLCTYDPQKITILDSAKNRVLPDTEFENFQRHIPQTRKAGPIIKQYRLLSTGPFEEFNQIAQTGFA
jgi:hypothetical protein